LIWNFIPGSPPDYNTVVDLSLGKALVAGAGFSTWTYRVGFDVSLPVHSSLAEKLQLCAQENDSECTKTWLAVSSQTNLHSDYYRELSSLPELVQLKSCDGNQTLRCYDGQTYRYPEVLQVSTYLLVK